MQSWFYEQQIGKKWFLVKEKGLLGKLGNSEDGK